MTLGYAACDPLQELKESQTTIEGLRSSLKLAEDKYNKIVKTVKVARNRIQALTTEKDKVSKTHSWRVWP